MKLSGAFCVGKVNFLWIVMNPVDLSKLNYERLQRYRKSLTDRNRNAEYWGEQDPTFIKINNELNRVLKECLRRNVELSKENQSCEWANVPTVKEFPNKRK